MPSHTAAAEWRNCHENSRENYMSVSEFESYLQKGLGRAILLLRKEPVKTPFRDPVWNHAIHDPRYDRQYNAPRGHYIKELFDCFSDSDALLSELFRIYGEDLGDPEDRWYYIENLFELAREHIEGASAALDSMYCILFENLLTLPNPLTDGRDRERDAYFLAAERRYCLNHAVLSDLVRASVTLLQQSNRYRITDFTDFFDARIRVSQNEEFTAILAAIEKESPSYKSIVDSYRKESHGLPSERETAKENRLPALINWQDAIDFAIQAGHPRIPVKKSLWQNLSAEDKEEIARLAEEESDPLLRTVLLSQLRRYGEEILGCYPRDPSPLIAELEENAHVAFPFSSENMLIWELSRMTAKIRHPAVRDFALRSLSKYAENPESILYSSVIEAWMNNYRSEDADALTTFAASITDTDILHRTGLELLNTEQQIPEQVLLYLYENNPCSDCRNRIFMSLMARYDDMTNLPDPLALIREEAKLDCDYGTRKMARAKSIKKEESE